MSYDIPGFHRSYEAVGDLSGSHFRFVKLNGNVVEAVTAITDDAIGVLQNKPNEPGLGVFTMKKQSAATVMIDGVSRVYAGAAINAGQKLTINAVGQVIPAAVGNKVVGVAEDSVSAAGLLVSVLLKPLGGVAA
jgi:hypothetical protein